MMIRINEYVDRKRDERQTEKKSVTQSTRL